MLFRSISKVPFKGAIFHLPFWQVKWTASLTRFPRQDCTLDAIEFVGIFTNANVAMINIVMRRLKFCERFWGSNNAFEVIFAIIG